MLANFLGKSKPINFIVLLLLFSVAFILNVFLEFCDKVFTMYFIKEHSIVFGLFLVIFFFVNFIVSKNNLTFDNSYAFLFFILIISCFHSFFDETNMLVVNMLSLLFLRKIYSIQTLKGVFKKLFDAGFWLGIMCILNPFSIVFFMLIFATLIVNKSIRFQTILIPIIGFLVPLFLFFTYCFWFDKTADFIQTFYLYTKYEYQLYLESQFLIPFLVFGTLILISIFAKSPKALSVNNRFKKSWILLLIHFLLSVAFVIFSFERNGSELLILVFPSAIIIANGFEMMQKKIVKEGLLILLIIGAILSPIIL